jgi:Anti-sigma factor NepR
VPRQGENAHDDKQFHRGNEKCGGAFYRGQIVPERGAAFHRRVGLLGLVLLEETVTAGLHDMTKHKDHDDKRDGPVAPSVEPATPNAGQPDMNGQDHDVDVPALDSHIQGLIGRQLRTHYDALVGDKIPDNLLKLLADLAKSEPEPKKDN